MELRVEYVPIDSIRPYANNAKLHPAEQIEQIKKSIEEFGFNDPIAVWHEEIIEGHGRLIAATELGMEQVPVIRLDGLTDEQRRAYALIHNKLTMNSGFDVSLLQMELESLGGIDMEEYGFQELRKAVDEMDFHDSGIRYTPDGVTVNPAQTNDPYLPEHYDDADIEQYTANQESYIVKRRVIITFLPEQEPQVAAMLGVDGELKVVYDVDELEICK